MLQAATLPPIVQLQPLPRSLPYAHTQPRGQACNLWGILLQCCNVSPWMSRTVVEATLWEEGWNTATVNVIFCTNYRPVLWVAWDKYGKERDSGWSCTTGGRVVHWNYGRVASVIFYTYKCMKVANKITWHDTLSTPQLMTSMYKKRGYINNLSFITNLHNNIRYKLHWHMRPHWNYYCYRKTVGSWHWIILQSSQTTVIKIESWNGLCGGHVYPWPIGHCHSQSSHLMIFQ
jgi:hypothetical protein